MNARARFGSVPIDAAITRRLHGARTIRMPVHMIETINKLNRISRQLLQEMGCACSANAGA